MQPDVSAHVSLNDKDVFLKELRSITNPSHKKLEETPLSKAIVSPEISLEDYGTYLALMYSFMIPFEATIFPLLHSVVPDLEHRSKTALLKNDLDYLRSRNVSIPDLPLWKIPAEASLSHAAGSLYVIEGSTLGGKYIYKNIHAVLGLDASNGASYFNGYGAETGKQWTSFLEQFTNYAIIPGHKEEIFKGADDTFKTMFDLLNI